MKIPSNVNVATAIGGNIFSIGMCAISRFPGLDQLNMWMVNKNELNKLTGISRQTIIIRRFPIVYVGNVV